MEKNRKRLKREDVVDQEIGRPTGSSGQNLPLVTPGEVLREEFMLPMKLSARALARDIDVPANRIRDILKGERVITADTALRLGHRFGMSPEFWMNLQVAHDLELARRHWRAFAA